MRYTFPIQLEGNLENLNFLTFCTLSIKKCGGDRGKLQLI